MEIFILNIVKKIYIGHNINDHDILKDIQAFTKTNFDVS